MSMFTGTVGSIAKGSFFTESKSGYNPRSIWAVVYSCCTPPDPANCCDEKGKYTGTTSIFPANKNFIGDYPLDN